VSNFTVFGIDLAKNIFQVCATDRTGKCLFNKSFSREKLKVFIKKQQPCTIAMEACGSAHHWARLFQQYGHDIKLMSPQFVKPYVKSNKFVSLF
jgi:transposase